MLLEQNHQGPSDEVTKMGYQPESDSIPKKMHVIPSIPWKFSTKQYVGLFKKKSHYSYG